MEKKKLKTCYRCKIVGTDDYTTYFSVSDRIVALSLGIIGDEKTILCAKCYFELVNIVERYLNNEFELKDFIGE